MPCLNSIFTLFFNVQYKTVTYTSCYNCSNYAKNFYNLKVKITA